MISLSDERKAQRIKIVDELLYAKPLNKDLQIMDAVLTKMLRGSDKKLRDELWNFLDRWQFRVEITDILQDCADEKNILMKPRLH